jgi:hypothetical protein
MANLTLDQLNAIAAGDFSGVSESDLEDLYREDKSSEVGGLETVGSIVGGIASGAALGTLGAGPVGTIIGGIAGGAIGAFGGEALEDLINGKEVDLAKAAKEGAISAGFDVATLGAGKILRPVFRLTSTSKLSSNFKNLLDEVSPTQGSRASEAQTQQLLEQGGSSLSPRSIEGVGPVRRLFNELGEVGFISRGMFEKDVKKRKSVILSNLARWTNSESALSTSELGRSMFNIVEAGRVAASKSYGDGLNVLVEKAGSQKFPSNSIMFEISQFLEKNSDDFGSTLSNKTKQIAEEMQLTLRPASGQPIAANFESMVQFQKRLNSAIDDAMPGGANPNKTVAAELSELSTRVKAGIEKAVERRSTGLYKEYKQLNASYKDLMDGIMPPINANLIARAKKDDFDAFGSMLVSRQNTSSIKEFMKSLDKSFEAIKKANGDLPEGIKNSKQAKEIVRSSYVRNLLSGGDEDVIFNQSTINKFNRPDAQKRMAAVLGEDFPEFKKLINAVGDSLQSTPMGAFALALRSREIQGLLVAGPAAFSGLTGDLDSAQQTAAVSAAGVLGLPVVLYKLSKNPAAVRRLISLEKTAKEKPDVTPEFIVSSLSKVFSALNEDDRKSIKEELYNANYYTKEGY